MTDGLPHPKAQKHIAKYDLSATFASSKWCNELRVNGSRFGVVSRPADLEDDGFSTIVRNWTMGEIALVRVSHHDTLAPIDAAYHPPQAAR